MNIKTISILFLTLVVILFSGCSINLKEKVNLSKDKLSIDYPSYIQEVKTNELSCESLMDTTIWTEKDWNKDKSYITGEVGKGTDKLAIKIENNKLKFITQAAVGAGVAEGEEFHILQNNDTHLIAIYFDNIWGNINSFTLNKKNGMAVWHKSHADYITTGNPEVSSLYLICK